MRAAFAVAMALAALLGVATPVHAGACASSPCTNGALCVDGVNSFSCVCQACGPTNGTTTISTAALPAFIFAATGISSAGSSQITGSMAVYPATGSSVTGFPPATYTGTLEAGNTAANNLAISFQALYDSLASRPATTALSGSSFIISNLTLGPGVYSVGSTLLINAAPGLTLDALGNCTAEFVFNINTTLTMATGAVITLVNGADPNRVFWRVGSSATIGTNAVYLGMILASSSITFSSGGTGYGQLGALNGAIAFDGVGSTITVTNTSSCINTFALSCDSNNAGVCTSGNQTGLTCDTPCTCQTGFAGPFCQSCASGYSGPQCAAITHSSSADVSPSSPAAAAGPSSAGVVVALSSSAAAAAGPSSSAGVVVSPSSSAAAASSSNSTNISSSAADASNSTATSSSADADTGSGGVYGSSSSSAIAGGVGTASTLDVVSYVLIGVVSVVTVGGIIAMGVSFAGGGGGAAYSIASTA